MLLSRARRVVPAASPVAEAVALTAGAAEAEAVVVVAAHQVAGLVVAQTGRGRGHRALVDSRLSPTERSDFSFGRL